MNAAGVGCIVQIAPGTYTENIVMKPGITIMGQDMYDTVINGNIIMASDTTLKA